MMTGGQGGGEMLSRKRRGGLVIDYWLGPDVGQNVVACAERGWDESGSGGCIVDVV